jgi:alkylation response protein AidB-like acyl-CoA dehydrogenase
VEQSPLGDLLVTDIRAGSDPEGDGDGNGAVFRVDPATGTRTILSDFGNAAQGRLGQDVEGVAVRETGPVSGMPPSRTTDGRMGAHRPGPRADISALRELARYGLVLLAVPWVHPTTRQCYLPPMDFAHSERAQRYITHVERFVRERVVPNEATFVEQLAHTDDWRQWRIPPILEELKAEARALGLWNLFLPDAEHGAGLDNRDYAPIAEITGRSFLAPEVFNCSAPDTGNAEVLVQYGSAEQKRRWLGPLLAGDIRSAFAMTEPTVASSDATNMKATCEVVGDQVVLNGQKWWTSGAGDPRCAFLIFMGVTDPGAERHQRHSMVIVPMDTKGVKIVRMVPVFGQLDEPHGHAEIVFDDARVPLTNVIAGPGRGFEIAQGRLGPGRIHHCMRAIGAAERALERLCRRAVSRVAFGKPLANLGGNRDIIAESRMAIDQARLLTLRAAWALDTLGTFGALVDISAIKVVAPNVLQRVVDAAIQIHGGEGVADAELIRLLATARALRIADGPDEVHRAMVARLELRRYVA